MQRRWSLWALLIGMIAGSPLQAARIRVTGDRVNLRAAPQATSEVVGQVSTGEELGVLSGLDELWVEVIPPPTVDLWIFAELVHQGQVAVSRAQVRAGAGLNFHVVGRLGRGAPVQERGRLGDWLKIAPPDGSSLWVSREYVEPIPETDRPSTVPVTEPPDMALRERTPEREEVPLPPPSMVSADEASPPASRRAVDPPSVPSRSWEERAVSVGTVTPTPPVVSPVEPAAVSRTRPPVLFPRQEISDLPAVVGPARIPADRLSPRAIQGRPGRYEGQLSKASAIFFTPSRRRLVAIDRFGRSVTVCYVLGNEDQLNRLVGRRLAVEGPVYWFRSTQYPTLLAERIQTLP